jgi:FMN-dependent NADH-azoreductase
MPRFTLAVKIMTEKKSILHIISNAPPLFGGAAHQAIHLSDHLSNIGIQSEFISIDNVSVQPESKKIKRICSGGIGSLIAVYKHIKRINPPVIMIHGGVKRLIILSLILPGRFKVIFKITTDAEIDRINQSNIIRIYFDYRGVFVANITNIHCNVRHNWFVSNIPRKLIASHDGVKNSLCSSMRFIVIGAICPRKRTLEVIKQFLIAKKNNTIECSSRLYFYGPYKNSFAEYDSDYIASVFEMIRDCKDVRLEGNVDLSKTEIPGNSILVHSAESEGCPNSVLEFLNIEKPVIVSSNLRQNFPSKLQSFVNFVDRDNLFIEPKTGANGAKQILDELKYNYLNNIKCVVCSPR